MKNTEAIKRKLREKFQPTKLSFANGLSTGSTLLNLAMTGRSSVGFLPGYYYLFVGDTNSGKSWYARTFMAEASVNPIFDDYYLIYDDVENAALINTRKFFGKRLVERIQQPSDSNSTTVEEMYDHINAALKTNSPFIYVVDSETSLTSEADIRKSEQNRRIRSKGTDEETKGSYGDGKAKIHSSELRKLISPLQRTGSILIAISQTRDNIGFAARFTPKTRPGGHALEFYATVQLWSSVKGLLKKRIKGKDRQIGIMSKIRVKRSRFTGRDRTVEVPIYHSTGIDDIGSCVNYLIEEGHWSARKETVIADEFDCEDSVEKLVQYIEESNQEKKLRRLVSDVWMDIEEASVVKRKNRYT